MHALAGSRRDLIKAMGIGLAATAGTLKLAATPAQAQAGGAGPAQAPSGAPITRTTPRLGQALPAIGLGTFLTFDVIPGQNRDHLRAVVRRYWEGGARVFDTSPLYGSGEISIGHFATALGINDQMFVSNKIWSTGEYLFDGSHARRSLEQSLGRLWRQRIDVLHCHSLVNVEMIVPYLQAWKKEGLIRFVGVSHHENAYHAPLLSWIERGEVDFVQVNYSIFNRAAEERILPAAAERGMGVLVNMRLEKALTVSPRDQPDLQVILASWFPEHIGKNPTAVLYTADCSATYDDLKTRGVTFIEAPQRKPFGLQAVFKDLYGNSYALLEPGVSHA